MKKLLVTFSLGLIIQTQAAVEYDLRKGVDLTTTNVITQSLLNQLVDSGTISATNKGGIIRKLGVVGVDWPKIVDNPRYTNFLWLDTSTTPPTPKVYVPTGDAYTNWVASTVSPGTVTTLEIKDYTIQAVDLGTNSVPDYALVASSVSGNKIADNGIIAGKLNAASVLKGNFAFGAITGGDITNKTITFTNIADSGIISLNIANNTIEGSKITNGGITTVNIAATNITRDLIRNDAIGTSQITNAAVTTNQLAGQINNSLLHTNTSYGVVKVWAMVDSAGTLVRGFNVASTERRDAGDFKIYFASSLGVTNYAVSVMALGTAGRALSYYSNEVQNVNINIQSVAGAPVDEPFSISILSFQ